MNHLLNRLSRKLGRYAISNLMYILSGGMLFVYLADYLLPQLGVGSWIGLNWNLVLQGQVWRVVSFVFAPPASSPLWILLSLYFNCLIGSALEREWGTFRFNVYYLVGVIGAIITAAVTGFASNVYLNLSLFLCFAILYPNFEVTLFFLLPIKVKYLAILDAVGFVWALVSGSWSTRMLVLMAVLNVLLFFGQDWLKRIRAWWGFRKTRNNFRKYMR